MIQRDAILFNGSVVPYGNGLARFQAIRLDAVEQLLSLNFIASDTRQNRSPTTSEFVAVARSLIQKYPKLKHQLYFHGVAPSPENTERQTTLEGLGIERGEQDLTPELKIFLKAQFRNADDLQFDGGEFFCWYD